MKFIRAFSAGAALAAAAAFLLGACVAVEEIAPPVTAGMGSGSAASAATLTRGRDLYVGRCTACHRADPVAKHGPADWRRIIAAMSDRSKLTPADEDAVLSYVLAARGRAGI